MGEVRPGLHVGCKLPFHAVGCPDYREDGKDWPAPEDAEKGWLGKIAATMKEANEAANPPAPPAGTGETEGHA
jgi:hypothetical protein